MRIVCIGGGPAGLYLAALMKKADPAHDVTVVERNRPDDTFGFGVVFSDATLENFAEADRETHEEIARCVRPLGRHRVHYRRHRDDLGRARLRRDVPAGAARHPPAALRPAGREARVPGRGRRPRAVRRRRPDPGRRRREQHGARAPRRRVPPPRRLAAEPVRLARHDVPVPGLHVPLQGGPRTGCGGSTPTGTPTATSTFILETTEATWRRAGLDRRDRGRHGAPSRSALFARGAATGTGSSRTGRSGAASRRCGTRAGPTATSCSSATPPTPRTSRSARERSSRWRTPSRSRKALRRHADVARGPRRIRGRAAPRGREPPARGPGQPRMVRADRALPAAGAPPVRVHPTSRGASASPTTT